MPSSTAERLVWMFTQMLRIREFEERVKRTFEDHPGVIRGHTHLADGAEASIVGSLATLAPRRPAADDVPLPRLPDRARHRHEGADGRDLRPQGRALRRLRRLDAPDRRLARVHGDVRHRRAGHPARGRRGLRGPDPRQGPGRAQLLRRRRLQAGRLPRVAEHRVALEAADRLRHGEQQLQRRHARRAGGRERRRRRAAGGEGEGVLDARRDGRRRRPARRATRRSGRRSSARGPARGRRSSSRSSTA